MAVLPARPRIELTSGLEPVARPVRSHIALTTGRDGRSIAGRLDRRQLTNKPDFNDPLRRIGRSPSSAKPPAAVQVATEEVWLHGLILTPHKASMRWVFSEESNKTAKPDEKTVAGKTAARERGAKLLQALCNTDDPQERNRFAKGTRRSPEGGRVDQALPNPLPKIHSPNWYSRR